MGFFSLTVSVDDVIARDGLPADDPIRGLRTEPPSRSVRFTSDDCKILSFFSPFPPQRAKHVEFSCVPSLAHGLRSKFLVSRLSEILGPGSGEMTDLGHKFKSRNRH